mmetsp:Transcript_44115/g.95956  ORF Transcript_44115/g.95956 Transcript_44115/m.95956 type:complete len:320 (+) Transcript_44115:404-1363(+)
MLRFLRRRAPDDHLPPSGENVALQDKCLILAPLIHSTRSPRLAARATALTGVPAVLRLRQPPLQVCDLLGGSHFLLHQLGVVLLHLHEGTLPIGVGLVQHVLEIPHFLTQLLDAGLVLLLQSFLLALEVLQMLLHGSRHHADLVVLVPSTTISYVLLPGGETLRHRSRHHLLENLSHGAEHSILLLLPPHFFKPVAGLLQASSMPVEGLRPPILENRLSVLAFVRLPIKNALKQQLFPLYLQRLRSCSHRLKCFEIHFRFLLRALEVGLQVLIPVPQSRALVIPLLQEVAKNFPSSSGDFLDLTLRRARLSVQIREFRP